MPHENEDSTPPDDSREPPWLATAVMLALVSLSVVAAGLAGVLL